MNVSINGQDGWFVDPGANFNEKLMNVGTGVAYRGVGVWFLNNTVTSGGFGNQPVSPAFTKANGESTVRTVGGGDSMIYSFQFRTVSNVADGSSFTLSFSPTGGDRHDYLRIVNDLDVDGGLRMYAFDGLNLDLRAVTQNISRGVWHHLKVVNTNPDGSSNDTVEVYLDDILISTHTTWEDWRTALPAATLAVNRVLFRMSIAGTTDDPSFTSPLGFYIDDFYQLSFNSSAPNTIIESYSADFEP